MEKDIKHQKESKSPYESVDKLYENQLQSWKKLAELQLEFAGLWQEYCNACFQRLSAAKDVSDLYAIEAGLSAEYGNKFTECSRKAFEAISETQQEMMGCFSSPENLFQSMFTD